METGTEVLKQELEDSANNYKQKIEEELEQSFTEIQRIATIAITVGSVIMFGYSLFKAMSKDKPKQSEHPETLREEVNTLKPNFLHAIASAGTEMVAVFLLSYARKKLKDYINGLDFIQDTTDETAE
jgi:hypothetical protein